MTELEKQESEQLTAYIERLTEGELEEGEKNPIVYGDMPFFHCELTGGLNRLCFSTADDPFQKTTVAKYYPEVLVFKPDGSLGAKINPFNSESDEFAMNYSEDIRDPVLKINDDKKIHLNLGGIKEVGTMVLLTVK
jgi:hypothetical protein